MLRRWFKTVFVMLLVLVFSSIALALPLQDALSARPAQSVYNVLRVDDLNGLLREIFSPANVEMLTSFLKPEDAQGVNLVAALASQIPAKSVLIASGMTAEGPFVQVAATMPESVYDKLNRVSSGSATGIEIVTLLLGDGGMMFADGFSPEVQKGPKGPYYTIMGQVAFAAKDNLLLVASSPAELEASLGALEKKDNRLSVKRRFDSPNYWFMHMDMSMTAALAEQAGGLDGNSKALTKFFKAPLELEFALSSKPSSFLLSGAVNVMESIANSERYKNTKPVKGANLFLAGGGKLLFALSSPLAFKASDLKMHPETAAGWDNIIKELEKINITEKDVEDLLNGAFTIALGSDATVMGNPVPGGYLAFTGRKGTAARLLKNIMGNDQLTQAVPLVSLKVNGWDSAFAVDPAISPAPLVFGVMKDTLFIGILNSEALTKTPELPAEVTKILKDPLLGVGVIDAAGIWSRLRQEVADPNSLLSAVMQDPVKGIVNNILAADLSVPLIKTWSSDMETGFIEFSVVDVPKGKRLLPRLVELGKMFAE